MTILLYVRRKGWPLESVTIECSHERVREGDDESYIELIRRSIHLKGDLSDEQKERVAQIARRCPIHRTLESRPRIQDEVYIVRE